MAFIWVFPDGIFLTLSNLFNVMYQLPSKMFQTVRLIHVFQDYTHTHTHTHTLPPSFWPCKHLLIEAKAETAR